MVDAIGSADTKIRVSSSDGSSPQLKARAASASASTAGQITELRVSGHLMTLEEGLFCIVRQPSESVSGEVSGLPGVRISLPPDSDLNPGRVTISSFRQDGWLASTADAALVRVNHGPANILVTVYQLRDRRSDQAPRLQVLRLSQQSPITANVTDTLSSPAPPRTNTPDLSTPGIMAHIQKTGDVFVPFGAPAGARGSKFWIEGFALKTPPEIAAADLEYQAVLGRGWLSPWMTEERFCGSRGMALPLLGLRVRLIGEAAKTHTVIYEASFIDGSSAGPVSDGEACEAESLAPLESMQVSLHQKVTTRSTSKTSSRRSR